ncbi:TPA: restriction endonuclease subunit S [Streptococcus suis]|nr:restriction endonuclease subunit S [Streptococcus suis]HEP1801158.1 restriction endonuclease subunit S [Streptococcus suis]
MKYKELSLGELVSFVSKGIPPKYTEIKTKDSIVVLNQKTNRNFQIDYSLSRLNDLTKKKVPKDKILIDNDILINSTGVGTAGRIAQLVKVPELTTVDGHMIIVRPDVEKIDPLYLGYALKAQQAKIEGLQEGSTGQTELNRQRLLKDIIVRFPESRRLQQKISKLFFFLDEKIENNKKINHHLEQMAMAIFKSWFVDFEPFGREMPKNWKEYSLLDVVNINYGKNLPTKNLLSEGYRVFGGNGQIGYFSDFHHKKERVLISCRGAASGTVHTSRPFSFITNNSLVVNEQADFHFAYLKQWCLNRQFFDVITGSAQPQITIDSLKSISIIMPEANILKLFSKILSPLYLQLETNKREMEILIDFRDTLLPKLLSGEICVNQATK